MADTEYMQNLNSSNNDYLVVKIKETFYAFSVFVVREVLPMVEIYSTDSLNYILGIINLRGETIPVWIFPILLRINQLQ